MNCVYSTGKQMKFQGDERFYFVTHSIAHVTPTAKVGSLSAQSLLHFKRKIANGRFREQFSDGQDGNWLKSRIILGASKQKSSGHPSLHSTT